MNPRRPTPAGPQPAPLAWHGVESLSSSIGSVNGLQQDVAGDGAGLAATRPLGEGELRGFLEWCTRHASLDTCRQYTRKIEEILSGAAGPEKSRWHVTAWKRFNKWLCEERGRREACEEFKRWKSRSSRPDFYVPSLEEVRAALASAAEPYRTVYMVLVQSGLRLSEACRLLREIDGLRAVRLDGFIRVELAWERGTKKAFWAYLLEPPPKIHVTPEQVSKYADREDLLPPKYLRKFVATQLANLGCDMDTIDFIQGRTPTRILTKHYADLTARADKCYKRYAEWLRADAVEGPPPDAYAMLLAALAKSRKLVIDDSEIEKLAGEVEVEQSGEKEGEA